MNDELAFYKRETARLALALQCVVNDNSLLSAQMGARDALHGYSFPAALPAEKLRVPYSFGACVNYWPGESGGYFIVAKNHTHFLSKDGVWTPSMREVMWTDITLGMSLPGKEYYHPTWKDAMKFLGAQQVEDRQMYELALRRDANARRDFQEMMNP